MTTTAEPLVRTGTPQLEATVVAVTDLGGGVRRVTCAAEGLRTFVPCGPDEYVGLVMPAAHPATDRPALRWYAIRDHDPVLGLVDIDIVTHGDGGPGSAWARRARRGDPVGIRAGGARYRGGEEHGRQLLVADETAVPSVAAILDSWGGADDARDQRVEVHVEVADPAVLAAYDLRHATVHHRTGVPGSALVPALQGALAGGGGPVGYAWVCGEAALVAGARRVLRGHGVDPRAMVGGSYWRLGHPRG